MPRQSKLVAMTGAVVLGFALVWGLQGRLQGVLAYEERVGRLPAMGYNAWNAYQCEVTEDLVIHTTQVIKSLGLYDAGYTRMNLDDCWSEKNRSSSGDLVPSMTRFPSGMQDLTSKLHDLGFQAGIYGDSGWLTCAGYPGSFQNEERDAKAFSDWGFDYLKYDNCAIPYDSVVQENVFGKYARMSNAISDLAESSGRSPLLFSLCEWGWSQVWLWGAQLGQSWRTTDDIEPTWASLAKIINFNSFITMATNFYGRNDLDMLQVGNGKLTVDETKAHFTAWALMKSPLLIGTNLSAIKPSDVEILKNEEIIAINQDPVVGTSISPFRWGVNPDWTSDPKHPAGYWSGPSQNGTVIMLLNTLDETTNMFFNLTESPWIRAGRQYSVRDLWTHTDNGTAVRNFTAKAVPSHGVVALLLSDAGPEPEGAGFPCVKWWYCTDKNGTRVGG